MSDTSAGRPNPPHRYEIHVRGHRTSAGRPNPPQRYEIRVRGHLAARWAARFDGMTITPHSDGSTVLDGPVVDQAALHGLLHKVRDLGLPLISVVPLDTDPHPGD